MGIPFNDQMDAGSSCEVEISHGRLEGTRNSGLLIFRGIPFARPPVGELRWKPPQPVMPWQGVRKADQFGPRPMQPSLFPDMCFRSPGMSEDCLYLNVWTPSTGPQSRLPVLVYFFGGGFQAGDGSEGRYDGATMARKGMVVVTVNYRLNIFGFMAHPDLSRESAVGASGNYGLMDQTAALRWVQDNIAVFGGDAAQVTIAGESAGSISVSAHMASPLSKGLFARAIGQSGSVLGTLMPVSLDMAEEMGLKLSALCGGASLSGLRSLSADKLLEQIAGKIWKPESGPGEFWFPLCVDGEYFSDAPLKVFEEGHQALVPLLAGWNSEEMNGQAILGGSAPTMENYIQALKRLYPGDWQQALKLYGTETGEDVMTAATNLAGDRFIGMGSWKWVCLQSRFSRQPVYRYYYAHPRPAVKPEQVGEWNRRIGPLPRATKGAVHSAEIEYALGNLLQNDLYDWTADDFKVSEWMQEYFVNFITTGNPNGTGLPVWPVMGEADDALFMRLDVNPAVEKDHNQQRYRFVERMLLL